MALAAGSHVGPYQVLSPLGAGGMGEVYRARDTRLERTVARAYEALGRPRNDPLEEFDGPVSTGGFGDSLPGDRDLPAVLGLRILQLRDFTK